VNHAGAIVGGVIGGFAFLLCVVVMVTVLYRRKNKKIVEEFIPLENKSITAVTDIVVKARLGGGHFSDVYKGEWQVGGDWGVILRCC
jgi:hypothetical protein